MFQIFTSSEHPQGNVWVPPLHDWVQRNLALNLQKVFEYYKTRAFNIPNNHVLNRVIALAMAPLNYEYSRFLDVVGARAPYVGKAMQFTSSINVGSLQSGSFYGPSASEYILEVSSYVSPFEKKVSLLSKKPVSVVTHNVNSFDFSLPTPDAYVDVPGLAVIKVDIALLLAQYRSFYFQMQTSTEDGSATPKRFLMSRVLPSMLTSHLEWCWINRLMSQFYGQPIQHNQVTIAMSMQDYSGELDKIAKLVLDKIQGRSMQYISMLENIPMFFHRSALDFLRVPDMALTRHVWWLVLMSRFKVMQFLIDLGGKKGQSVNASYYNQLKVDLSRLQRGGFPTVVENDDEVLNFNSMISSLLRNH